MQVFCLKYYWRAGGNEGEQGAGDEGVSVEARQVSLTGHTYITIQQNSLNIPCIGFDKC